MTIAPQSLGLNLHRVGARHPALAMNDNSPYLDGWRGLAILCLLIGHFFPVPGINLGTVGVALFFVLSGLLMAKVLFVQNMDIKTFYRRRVSRVFPSIAVYLVVVTMFFAMSGNELAYGELFAAATFTNNYFVSADWTMPFGHIWSLSVEEHSYVILTLAAYWSRRHRHDGMGALRLILSLILLAIACYSILSPDGEEPWHLRTEVASFGIFFSGFLFLGAMYGKCSFSSAWLAPLALGAGILAHWWNVPDQVRVVLGWGALAVSINAMTAAPRWLSMILESSFMRRLGLYSFSLYLWQQPFYQWIHERDVSPIVGLVLSLAVGGVAYYLVENPARIYLNRHWAKKPVTAVDVREVRSGHGIDGSAGAEGVQPSSAR